MNKFRDLLPVGAWPTAPADQQQVERQFQAVVARSHLHRWSPGMPLPSTGMRILLGVAPYSVADMRLLDRLEELLAQRNGTPVRWDVFNTLDCQRPDDFAKFVPGLDHVFQTPVIGVWEDGTLREKAWGKPARDLVLRLSGLGAEVESHLFE